jgi:hypothetical protein
MDQTIGVQVTVFIFLDWIPIATFLSFDETTVLPAFSEANDKS